MKRFIYLALAVIIGLFATACERRIARGENAAENAVSDPGGSQSPWDGFLKEMEPQGIGNEAIETLENNGMAREEIMSMSSGEIENKLAEIEAAIQQNKMELAKEMLADWSGIKKDSRFVYSDTDGSTNLHLVEKLIDSIKANEAGSLQGMFLGTIPVAYELSYEPNGELLFTRYSGWEEIAVSQIAITDIYITDTFYEFKNEEGFGLSITKVPLTAVELVEGYPNGSDFHAVVPQKQAEETMVYIDTLLNGYIDYMREKYDRDVMGGFGMIIPEGFTAQAAMDTDRTVVVDGTARILGQDYYRVCYYEDGAFSGTAYYINGEEPEAGTVFLVSMADGSLYPVCYKHITHLPVKG